MAVSLTSLRVNADFDASGYIRGAKAKVAADEEMIASDRRANAARAQADAANAKAVPGYTALAKSLLQGYSAGQQFEQQIRKIGKAVDQGLGLDRAAVLIEAANKKFGLTADVVALAAGGYSAIVPLVDAANRKFEAHNEVLARTKAATDALAGAQKAQHDINSRLGIVPAANDNGARAADVAAYGRQLDDLRAKFNPLFAAGRQYKDVLAEINMAARVGAISETERASALARTKTAFADQVAVLRGVKPAGEAAAAGVGLARHELINLGRQAQDVVVSLQGGQGLGTVLLQQGSQIGDVFATSQGTIGGFVKQVTGSLGGLLAAGRLAFGGVTIAIGGAALALNSYLDSQNKVQRALAGAGRTSGATAGDINAAANAGAAFGLSAASARELAAALVQTGKVANDNLLPIVKIGKDFASTFGVDAAEATRMLAQAFADPVRGAEQLNDRLGFMDAAMQRQIGSLVAQNRTYEAQKVLLDAVQGALARSADVTSIWSQMWTGVKNAASNAFDTIGARLAKGLGLDKSLQDQAEQLKAGIASYESGWGRIFGSSADLENLKRQLADVNGLIEKRALATQNVATAQASLRVSNTVMTQLPELQRRQSLSDQAGIAGAVAEDPGLQQSLGISQAQADRVRAILGQVKSDFKTTFEEIQASSKIASDAVTAFSPAAKALIAARQAAEQYRGAGGLDPGEKAKIAQDAYNLSLQQSIVALSEQARARALSANQAVASAQLEIDMAGKSVGQQAEMRANLQARMALQQQASQQHREMNAAEEEELAMLVKPNAKVQPKQKPAVAVASNDNSAKAAAGAVA